MALIRGMIASPMQGCAADATGGVGGSDGFDGLDRG
jgi:hypothetical protein